MARLALLVFGVIILLLTALTKTYGSTNENIDLLVLYTEDVADMLINYGEAKSVLTEIEEAVAYAQAALDRSGVNINLNLIDTIGIDFITSSNPGETLQWLTLPNDGQVDYVHRWRDSLSADIVSLIATSSTIDGIAGWPHDNSTAWENEAFFIVFTGNDMGDNENRTFAHELGHNLGGLHDWYSGENQSLGDKDDPYKYHNQNRGFIHFDESDSSGFYTIMSYASYCYDLSGTCEAIPYFSNPDISYNGVYLGIPALENQWDLNPNCYNNDTSVLNAGCPSDMAGIFNWMAPTISSYRSSNGPDGKVFNLEGSFSGEREFQFTFDKDCNNETGYRVQRSTDNGQNYYLYDTIDANVLNYYDTINAAVNVHEPWVYRIQAMNDNGFTTYSEDTVVLNLTQDTVDFNFENGAESINNWTNDLHNPWFVADRGDALGKALRADIDLPWGDINAPAKISKTIKCDKGFISFEVKASTLVQFAIGETYVKNAAWSFTNEWDTVAIPIEMGEHTVRWEFFGGGEVWIDNVNYPSLPNYTVNYTSDANGYLTGDTIQTIDKGSSTEQVRAVANDGYIFSKWNDGRTDNPRVDINVFKDSTVKAEFILNSEINMLSENSLFTVYPNPAKDYVIIKTSNQPIKNGVYALFNATGRIIKSGEIRDVESRIDMAELPNSVYLLIVQVNNQYKAVNIGKVE